MKKIKWRSETRNIADLKPAKYNPRKISSKQKTQLKKSIDKFSLADPLVINKNNTVIGGHQRLEILKVKKVATTDVRVPDRLLTNEEEKELNLRLNKNLGEWDMDLLSGITKDLLIEVGFDFSDVDKIVGYEPADKDDNVPEVPKKSKTKPGDIYQLGLHRLLCGDSTKFNDVEKLMENNYADMVFTDPPYGVSYGDKNKFLNTIAGAIVFKPI